MTEKGWHPDPEGRNEYRYHDGTRWTPDVANEGKQTRDPISAPPGSAPAAHASSPGKKHTGRNILLGIVGLFILIGIISAASGGGSSDSTGSSDSGNASSSSAASDSSSKKSSCGIKATDDCTPRRTADQQVRVDALVWKVLSARTASSIGDQQFGAGAKAQGKFVVVKLRVHSVKKESATLTDDIVKLTVDGKTYSSDSDGTFAASTSGEEPFLLNDIGPDSNRTGTVVFDVPDSVLSQSPDLRFNELGFGQTHGFIKLPTLSASD